MFLKGPKGRAMLFTWRYHHVQGILQTVLREMWGCSEPPACHVSSHGRLWALFWSSFVSVSVYQSPFVSAVSVCLELLLPLCYSDFVWEDYVFISSVVCVAVHQWYILLSVYLLQVHLDFVFVNFLWVLWLGSVFTSSSAVGEHAYDRFGRPRKAWQSHEHLFGGGRKTYGTLVKPH